MGRNTSCNAIWIMLHVWAWCQRQYLGCVWDKMQCPAFSGRNNQMSQLFKWSFFLSGNFTSILPCNSWHLMFLWHGTDDDERKTCIWIWFNLLLASHITSLVGAQMQERQRDKCRLICSRILSVESWLVVQLGGGPPLEVEAAFFFSSTFLPSHLTLPIYPGSLQRGAKTQSFLDPDTHCIVGRRPGTQTLPNLKCVGRESCNWVRLEEPAQRMIVILFTFPKIVTTIYSEF